MVIRHLRLLLATALLLAGCGNSSNELATGETQLQGTLLFGGDVFLARHAHVPVDRYGYDYPFAAIKHLFAESDATLINLEAVISSGGRGVDTKGERSSFLFRGRPDLVRVLTEAGVDMVTGANNHSGDYGPEALMEQMAILDAAGIRYTGIGHNRDGAGRHRLLQVGNLVVAVIGVDSTMPAFDAGPHTPGNQYLDESHPSEYVNRIQQQVRLARHEADLVIMTVHWGPNGRDRPTPQRRLLAQRLIREAGLDAILGHSAHVIQGMELVDGKPVLYDAGNLMLDYNGSGWNHKSLLFRLTLTPDGVSTIELHPIRLHHTRTEPADEATAAEILDRFEQLSLEFSPDFVLSGNRVYLPNADTQTPLAARSSTPQTEADPIVPILPQRQQLDPPARVSQLPDDLIPLNHTFSNGITLLGMRPLPDGVRRRHGFFITSYWSSAQTPQRSELITVRLRPLDGQGPVWGNSDTYRDHHPGDWSYPTDLWQAGEWVEDYYFVRGHANPALTPHRVYLGMAGEEVSVGEIEILP